MQSATFRAASVTLIDTVFIKSDCQIFHILAQNEQQSRIELNLLHAGEPLLFRDDTRAEKRCLGKPSKGATLTRSMSTDLRHRAPQFCPFRNGLRFSVAGH